MIGKKAEGRGARTMRARPLRLLLCILLALAQLQPALAAIVNTVTVTGVAGSVPIEASDTESVPLIVASPAMAVTKTGTLNDDDGTPGVSPGDSVTFTVTIANTGNVSLAAVTVTDPLVSLMLSGGDTVNPGILDVGETWSYIGTYVLTLADISTNGGGDGDIDNIVTVSAAGLQTQQAAVAVPLSAVAAPVLFAGTVFDAASRAALSGAAVTLTGAGGNALPPQCFANPSQQGQTTDSAGVYRFDILPGFDPACPSSATEYRLNVVPPSGYAPPPSAILPPAPGALDAVACPPDPVPGGDCEVSPASSAPPSGPVTYYFAVVVAAAGSSVVNNHIPLDPLPSPPGAIVKTALKSDTRRGEQIPFLIEVTAEPGAALSVADAMPAGFAYVPASARVNGVPLEPMIDGQRLVFSPVTADAQGRLRIELSLIATAAAKPGRYVNQAELFDPATGTVLSRSTAAFAIVAEPVFDCSDVIGRVFADRNRNGYPDQEEKGLPHVRIATVRGLIVTTDRLGRFHVSCAGIPGMKSGSNFVMKLDPRSLPDGYRLTTENPRSVRLTRGKATKLNFGAAPPRLVRLDLRAEAFADAELTDRWRDGLAGLVHGLVAEPSLLRISYTLQGESRTLALRRIETVRKLIERHWREAGGEGTLDIETRLSGEGNGAP